MLGVNFDVKFLNVLLVLIRSTKNIFDQKVKKNTEKLDISCLYPVS